MLVAGKNNNAVAAAVAQHTTIKKYVNGLETVLMAMSNNN
jgi:hypothetical protein